MFAALTLGLLTSVGSPLRASQPAANNAPAATDDAPAVRVTLNGHTVFDPGDRAQVHVSVRDDGYLLVLQQAPDGSVSVLFPRLPSDDDMVRGGTGLYVQGAGGTASFIVGPTGGAGMVYAAVSKTPFHVSAFATNGYWNQKSMPTGASAAAENTLTGLVQQMADSNGRFDYDLVNYTVTRSNRPGQNGLVTAEPGSNVYIYDNPWGGGWYDPWYAGWGWGGGGWGFGYSPWYNGYGVGLGFGPGYFGGFYGGGYGGYYGGYGRLGGYGGYYNPVGGWRPPGTVSRVPTVPYRSASIAGVGIHGIASPSLAGRVSYRGTPAQRVVMGGSMSRAVNARAGGFRGPAAAVRVPAGPRANGGMASAPRYQGGGGRGNGGGARASGRSGGGGGGGGHGGGGHGGGGGGGGHHR